MYVCPVLVMASPLELSAIQTASVACTPQVATTAPLTEMYRGPLMRLKSTNGHTFLVAVTGKVRFVCTGIYASTFCLYGLSVTMSHLVCLQYSLDYLRGSMCSCPPPVDGRPLCLLAQAVSSRTARHRELGLLYRGLLSMLVAAETLILSPVLLSEYVVFFPGAFYQATLSDLFAL